MMILLALLFHLLGHNIPLWITGQKMRDVRAKGGWKQIYFEMSGVVFVFLLAFIVLTVDGLTTKEKYLLNENVIYGLYFSQNAKDLGFKDGDKIISVNDKTIIEFDDIVKDIKHSYDQISIRLKRVNRDTIIVLTNKEKHQLIMDGTPFVPQLNADTAFNRQDDIVYNERQRSLSKSIAFFPQTVRLVFRIYNQILFPKDYSKGGTIYLVLADTRSFFYILGWNLILFGFLNLLPIPGLDIGNTTIALIEKTRKKKYNPKRIRIMRYVCIGIISLLIILILLYSQI